MIKRGTLCTILGLLLLLAALLLTPITSAAMQPQATLPSLSLNA